MLLFDFCLLTTAVMFKQVDGKSTYPMAEETGKTLLQLVV